MDTVIRLDEVSVVLGGRPVLNAVSLALGQDEFVTLRGPNGAGKTTLLRCMLGLVAPSAGRVERTGGAGRIGYVPQVHRGATAMPLLVRDVVAIGRCAHPGRGRAARAHNDAAIRQALRRSGIATLADRPINMLSGGEQQKMQLARVLAQEPALLLLDEPTAHLDTASRREFFALLEGIYAERGGAVLMVTHDAYPVPSCCRREIELRDGCLTTRGQAAAEVHDVRV